MPRYDEHTEKFMRDTVGAPKEEKKEDKGPRLTTKPIRVARAVLKGTEDPHGMLGKFLVSEAAKSLAKLAELKILQLYGFMNDHYGREWWDWEPETLWQTLREDHFSEGTPEEIRSAIQALQLTVKTMFPFELWHIFEKVGHAFNLNPVNFTIVQALEPDEAALTMGILRRIQPKTPFEPEVLIYVATCAKIAGMVFLPDEMFPGVQKFLDEITFEHDLRDTVKGLWGRAAGRLNVAEKIQLERLHEVQEYLVRGGLYA